MGTFLAENVKTFQVKTKTKTKKHNDNNNNNKEENNKTQQTLKIIYCHTCCNSSSLSLSHT